MNLKINILKNKKLIMAVIVVVILGLALSGFMRKKKVEVKEDIKNVKVIKASMTSLSTEVEYPGKLKGVQEISVSPKTPGKVANVNIKIGDQVQSGQVLFTLEAAELKAQLDQQEANLNASNANLAKTRDSAIQQQIIQADQSFKSAQIAYNDAKDYYDKTKKLYDSGFTAKQDLDTAQSKVSNAEIALNATEKNLSLIRDKSGPQSVQVAEAQVEQSVAAVNLIKAQLDNATITSSISGVVSAVNVHAGEMSSSATAAVTIIDSKTLIAEVNVPDKMLAKIQLGQTVPVRVSALANKDISGTIDNISPAADSKTQSYTVKVKIDNPNGELKPGMFSKIILPAEKKDSIIAIPNETIKIENGLTYIYTVSNGKVKKISINTGLSNSKITEIVSQAVKPGDSIITEGQIFLNDGEKVNIVK